MRRSFRQIQLAGADLQESINPTQYVRAITLQQNMNEELKIYMDYKLETQLSLR